MQTTLVEAYRLAYACDPVSAFGSIIAANRQVDLALVEEIGSLFVEVLVAPSYTPDALAWLAEHKKNCRVMRSHARRAPDLVLRSVQGGLLVQTPDTSGVDQGRWQVVTRRQPSEEERAALAFAWLAAKHVKSNAIVFVQGHGDGGGGRGPDEPGGLRVPGGPQGRRAGQRRGDGLRRLLPIRGWDRGRRRSRRHRLHPTRRLAA